MELIPYESHVSGVPVRRPNVTWRRVAATATDHVRRRPVLSLSTLFMLVMTVMAIAGWARPTTHVTTVTTTEVVRDVPVVYEVTRHNLHDKQADAEAERQRLKTKNEILWLARVIMSEDSDPYNQDVIAQVVRRRVEARYKGTDYKSVILARLQFSAFNTPSSAARYTKFNWLSSGYRWRRALRIATRVYFLPEEQMDVPSNALHFYALRSMVNNQPPRWAAQGTPMDMETAGVHNTRLQIILDAP